MNKVCVVTGGTGGIGAAAVREMAKDHKVLFADVKQEKIDAFVAELKEEGLSAEGMVCDVSDRKQCDALAQKAASMGKVVGVIHLAGLTPAFASHTAITRVECIGTLNINEAFYHVMDGGCIIDICSCVAHFMSFDRYPTQIFEHALTNKKAFYDSFVEMIEARGEGDKQRMSNLAYTFGRCFVRWYVRKAAYAFGRQKAIRLLSVSIGFVETPMSRADLTASGGGQISYEERLAQPISYSAFGRAGKPEEVAYLFRTLIDEKNSYLSGTDIFFDNGCDGSGYHGQREHYDPNSNPYNPAQADVLEF